MMPALASEQKTSEYAETAIELSVARTFSALSSSESFVHNLAAMRHDEHEPNTNDHEPQVNDDTLIGDDLGPIADFLLDLFLTQKANAQPVDNSLTNSLKERNIYGFDEDGPGSDSLTSTPQP